MSKQGVNLAANVFVLIQETRFELMSNSTDKQNLMLAQMFEEMKEFSKDKFSKLTLMQESNNSSTL